MCGWWQVDAQWSGELHFVPSGVLLGHPCPSASHAAAAVSQAMESIAFGLLEQLCVVLKGKGEEDVLPALPP